MIKKKLNNILINVKKFLNINTIYKIGEIEILLPSDHLLPSYQKKHRTYDRFLYYLVSSLEDDSSVIDVGANIGDTVCSMIQSNSHLNYYCIEGDNYFYSYLLKNIKKIEKNLKDNKLLSKIKCFNNLIGFHKVGILRDLGEPKS